MFVLVVSKLGGVSSISGIWSSLPASHHALFPEPYSAGFVLAMCFLYFLSYNGGSWSLATRYISSPSEKEAKKAAWLSGLLYLIWPLILFFPMWAAPLLLPADTIPNESYGRLMFAILPSGMIGLVIASLFAATMGMTSSDVNTVAAVIARDILPVVSDKFKKNNNSLKTARVTTFVFTLATILIALNYQHFGGVLGLIVNWFAALLGPTSMPLLFGLIPFFKSCGPRAAIASIVAGLLTFFFIKYTGPYSLAIEVGMPTLVASIVFAVGGIFSKTVPEKVEQLFAALREKQEA
jgi:Na+/proline symporter